MFLYFSTSRVQNGENNPRQLNEIATSEIPLESEMEVQISGLYLLF